MYGNSKRTTRKLELARLLAKKFMNGVSMPAPAPWANAMIVEASFGPSQSSSGLGCMSCARLAGWPQEFFARSAGDAISPELSCLARHSPMAGSTQSPLRQPWLWPDQKSSELFDALPSSFPAPFLAPVLPTG